jgi:hypothetical protein
MPSKKPASTTPKAETPAAETPPKTPSTPRVNHWRREDFILRIHDGVSIPLDFVEMVQRWGKERAIPIEVTSNGKRTTIRLGRTSRPREASLFFRTDLDEMRRLGINAADVRTFIEQKRKEREAHPESQADILAVL